MTRARRAKHRFRLSNSLLTPLLILRRAFTRLCDRRGVRRVDEPGADGRRRGQLRHLSGSGCINAIVGLEHTDTTGRFVFDAYGKYNPASDQQYVLPALDSESIGIVVYKPGYLGVQRYLHPEYQDYTDSDGKRLPVHDSPRYLSMPGE